jgi:hypothetical protein
VCVLHGEEQIEMNSKGTSCFLLVMQFLLTILLLQQKGKKHETHELLGVSKREKIEVNFVRFSFPSSSFTSGNLSLFFQFFIAASFQDKTQY